MPDDPDELASPPADSAPEWLLAAAADATALASSDRPAGRARLLELWDAIDDDDPLHRCAVAHALADVQDDPQDELAWDLQALAAADGLTDERVARAGAMGTARGFRPSLHLNLADVFARLGRPDEARSHVVLARSTIDALDADGYRSMIAGALDRIEASLADGPPVTDRSP